MAKHGRARLPFRAAVFDLDGTVLDSTYVWEWVDQEFLSRRGLAVPEDYIDAVCAKSFGEAADYTIRRFGLSEEPEAVIAEWRRLARYQYEQRVTLKPGVREYLEELRHSGVRLAVASGLERSLAKPALERNGIAGLFDLFCYAGEVSRGKEYPDLYLHAARQLGLSPEACVMFEDVLPGVRSAKAAGMMVFGVADPYSERQRDAIRALADGFLESFAEAPLPAGE